MYRSSFNEIQHDTNVKLISKNTMILILKMEYIFQCLKKTKQAVQDLNIKKKNRKINVLMTLEGQCILKWKKVPGCVKFLDNPGM